MDSSKSHEKLTLNILVSVVNILRNEQKMAEFWFENPNFNSFLV